MPSMHRRDDVTPRISSTRITHTMPLDKINDAFDLMHEGKSIRSVVIC